MPLGRGVRLERDGTINGDDLVAPVEIAKVLEEALEDVKGSMQLVVEVVQQKDDEHVESIRRHICSVRAQQSGVESEPAFEQQDRLFEQVVLSNQLAELLDKVKREKPSQLPNAYINWCACDFELYHKWVCLIYEVHVGQRQFGKVLLNKLRGDPKAINIKLLSLLQLRQIGEHFSYAGKEDRRL